MDDDGVPMTDASKREYLMTTSINFILAGRDTTATLLGWMFYALSINPEVQDRLAKEIDEKLQGKEPNFEDIAASKMPYLNAVVYETLRMYPPVPVVCPLLLHPASTG